jgi:ApaG protein
METKITNGIRISVRAFYQPKYSVPLLMKYVFSYKVFIENQSPVPVQLLNRHWLIFDSTGDRQEVSGEGVIGQQPILPPGSRYQYTSEIGSMQGYYEMRDLQQQKNFSVQIPSFNLIPAFKMN